MNTITLGTLANGIVRFFKTSEYLKGAFSQEIFKVSYIVVKKVVVPQHCNGTKHFRHHWYMYHKGVAKMFYIQGANKKMDPLPDRFIPLLANFPAIFEIFDRTIQK